MIRLAVALLLPLTAWAEDPWYLGLPVSEVRLAASGGGIPDEYLDPLLRMRQGQTFDPARVRLDITTLFRAGRFAAVEAEASPWMLVDEDGSIQEAVMLTYWVEPAPRVGRIRHQGGGSLPAREVLDAAGIATGDVFFPEVDAPATERRIEDHLVRQGFPSARVELDTWPLGDGRLEIWIRIDEGPPRTVKRLTFTGDLPVAERRLRRAARRNGVREGQPISPDAITAAQHAIRQELARDRNPLRPARLGWVGARVTPALSTDDDGVHLAYHIEAGPRLDLEVSGLSWRPYARIRDALEMDERLRLTRGFVEEAPERLESWLARRGHLQAQAKVALTTDDDVQVLQVQVEPGPTHRLVGQRALLRHPGIQFEGNDTLSDLQLRAVMEEASEGVLGRGRVTLPEVQAGLEAARQLYRSKGYQDAQLDLTEKQVRPRPSLWSVPGVSSVGEHLLGIEGPRDVRLYVEVKEGTLTRQGVVELQGAAPEVDLAEQKSALAQKEGEPFSPQDLDRIARSVANAHRDAGFLDADVRVRHHRSQPDEMESALVVQPGPRVLLRSYVVRGARGTRTPFLHREMDLALGEPLGRRDLDDLQQGLYDLGAFRSVRTDVLGDGGTRDLVVSVSERARWGFELGSGWSTDQGVRAFGRASRYNLWGLAHRLELHGSVGLDYGGSSDWMPDSEDAEWRAVLSYTAPQFPRPGQQLVVDLLLREELQERTWRLARSAVGVALEARLQKTTLRGSVRLEQRQLQEVDPGALLTGEAWLGDVLELPTPWRPHHTIGALVLHDRRDDPVEPSEGWLASARLEASPGHLSPRSLPTSPIVQGEVRGSRYVPIGPVTLHLSAEAAHGRVLGDGVLPLEERYRLGGTGSLRGYRRDGLGPRNELHHPTLDWPDQLDPAIQDMLDDDPTRWVATGGDARALGTAELLVPMPLLGFSAWRGHSAAFFLDAGQAWLTDPAVPPSSMSPEIQEIFNPPFRYSVGMGLRIATPVGPLQADLGFNPEAIRAQGARRELLQDRWQEPWGRVHVSLGALW